MRSHVSTSRRLIVLTVIAFAAKVFLGGSGIASAETLPFNLPSGETITLGSGAAFTATPDVAPPPINLGDGRMAVFVPTTPNPLDMNTGINRQVEEMNQQIKAGNDGKKYAGGYSAATVATWRWAQQTAGPKQLILQGSPNGPGSVAELLPNNPLITFNQGPLPADTKADIIDLRNDGYASCLNRASSFIECPAGAIVGHYCVVDQIVPGQCYASFNGQVTVRKVGNMTYYIGETRNPVAVLAEAGGKLIDRNFTIPKEVEDWCDVNLPQGDPGVRAEGLTLRQVLQPGADTQSVPAVIQAHDLTQPVSAPAEPVADPIAQANEVVQTAWNTAVTQTTKAVEDFANNAVAPVPAAAPAHPEPAPVPVDIVGAANVAVNTAVADLQAQANQFLAGLPH